MNYKLLSGAVVMMILGGIVGASLSKDEVIVNSNVANVNKSIECKNVNKCEVCENKTEYYPVEKVVEIKKTLSPEQRKSLESLVLKPYENWSEQDKKNWAYATDGLPVPFKTVTKVETKWVEKACAGNTNVNTNSNTNSSASAPIVIHMGDRLDEVKERIAEVKERLSENLKSRGFSNVNGQLAINLNRSR